MYGQKQLMVIIITLLLSDLYYKIPADVQVVYELVERIYNSDVSKLVRNVFPDIGNGDDAMAGVEVVKKKNGTIVGE